eukprot:m.340709 g.340709  ORF g.340709 m.340709 type:complete len:376 (+) comp20599_c0_seq1:281-1408(+)
MSLETMTFASAAEISKIRARQKFAEERRARILDPRNAKVGVDYAAIEAQIEERKLSAAAQAASDEQIAADLREYDRMALLVDRQERERRKARNAENARYLREHQKPETRDSYELNRKDLLRSSQPARVGDVDPRCGLSSMQVFAGEDLGYEERRKAQQNQVQQWAAESARIKNCADEVAAKAAKEEHDHLLHQVAHVAQIENSESTLRQQRTQDFKQANIEMLAAQREAARRDRLAKLDEDKQDMIAQVSGPLLSEDPSLAVGPTGKLLTDRFKGFTPAQLEEIRRTQEQQVAESTARRQQEEHEQREVVARQNQDVHTMLLAERQAARLRRQRNEEIAKANLTTARRKSIDRAPEQNSSGFQDSFFAQFGTSHR